MKKFFNVFFVTLGVMFFIIILFAVYFFIADPLEIRPFIKAMRSSPSASIPSSEANNENANGESSAEASAGGGFTLSENQKKALEAFGVDPNSLPSELTQEQVTCFEGVLGVERVEQIKNGESPSAIEFFKAKGCI